jgi:archaellum component FlaC
MAAANKNKNVVNRSEKLAAIAGLLGLISAIVGIAVAFYAWSYPLPSNPVQQAAVPVSIINEDISNRLNQMSEDLNQINEKVKNLSVIPEESKVAAQIKEIDSAIKDLQTRHSKLEEVIMGNPAKALEVPLLRKDLDNLKEIQQQSVASMKQAVDQVYDLNKWLLGAMAVSIIMLGISQFLKSKESETAQPK